MARINKVTRDGLDQDVEMALTYSRLGLAELTGRETQTMIEPLEVYAHLPDLFRGIGALEQSTAQLTGIDRRYAALAELKAATMTQCEYCIDLGSQISRRWGLSDAELLALANYRNSPEFDDVDRLVLDYAAAMSSTPVAVTDDLFALLKQHFTDAQVVELTHHLALENMRGRFNFAMGIGAAGFSEGMVCAIPA